MVRLKQFTSSLKNVIYPLTALFAATMFICCSYASLGSVFALKLKQLETPTSIAGLILAMYYLGCVVASFSASGIINKVGHIRAFGAFASMLSILCWRIHFQPTGCIGPCCVFWKDTASAEPACVWKAGLTPKPPTKTAVW